MLDGATATASGVGNGPFTTNFVTALPTGGVAPYTYQWSRVSGDATISVTNQTSAATAWQASGTAPENKNAIWKCTVTDAAGVSADSNTASISVAFQLASISVTLNTYTLSASGSGNGPFTTGSVTATPSGGTGPYTYSWTLASGDSAITPSSASAQTVTYSASGTAPEVKNASYQCTVTDSLMNSGTSSALAITVTFNVASLSVSLDTTTASGSVNGTGVAETNTITGTPSGGVAPYTYEWEYQSGDFSIEPTNTFGNATSFIRFGSYSNVYTGAWRLKVTDNNSNVAYSDSVNITCTFNPP